MKFDAQNDKSKYDIECKILVFFHRGACVYKLEKRNAVFSKVIKLDLALFATKLFIYTWSMLECQVRYADRVGNRGGYC